MNGGDREGRKGKKEEKKKKSNLGREGGLKLLPGIEGVVMGKRVV